MRPVTVQFYKNDTCLKVFFYGPRPFLSAFADLLSIYKAAF